MKHRIPSLSRRAFLRNSTATIATLSIVPASVLGLNGAEPPGNKLNIACIGVGGRGYDDLKSVVGENIVALCDVDSRRLAEAVRVEGRGDKNAPKDEKEAKRREETAARLARARQFQDFRKMMDEMEKQIDAVVVATPDHTHAVAVMRAIKAGKHVYCEKPMAHSIADVRAMVNAARQHKVVTQLGNQGHSSDSIRKFCEWVWAGAVGEVKELHGWCGSSYGRIRQLDRLQETPPVPANLDWDLWLGPAAQRPYNPVYLPGAWRGWWAFGTGVLGDWTCHVIDPVFWAYDLGAPTSVVAETFDYDPKRHGETFPTKTIIRYEFPAKGRRPAVTLTWRDGGPQPDKPAEMGADEKLPQIGGLVIGDKGKIVYGSHGAGKPQILPDERMDQFAKTPQEIPRSPGHHEEWIKACKTGGQCGSNFNYGGPLTEIALLGDIAIRFAGQKLQWNSAAMRFTNVAEANAFVKPPNRKGWKLA